MEAAGLVVAVISLCVSALTAWLTMGRRGRLRLAQPATIYFGPDGSREKSPKVFLRGLLYSTAAQGVVVEGMYVRLKRGDSTQTFPIWVLGDRAGDLARGAGIFVPKSGTALHHHFLLPNDGTTYTFLPGTHTLEIYARVVGKTSAELLVTLNLSVAEDMARTLRDEPSRGLYFDWGPDTRTYQAHVAPARRKDEMDGEIVPLLLAELAKPKAALPSAETGFDAKKSEPHEGKGTP